MYVSMDALFDEWINMYKKKGLNTNLFCKDGIIKTYKYSTASPKILFVMKDFNDPREGCDLREFLGKGPLYQMWHTTARWAVGLLKDFPSYETIDNYSTMKDALLQVAVVNLKKTSGGSTVLMSTIEEYANEDRQFIFKQIKIINPDIIIICGVGLYGIFISLFEVKNNQKKNLHEPFYDKNLGAWIVPMRHPSRANNRECYKKLKRFYKKTNGFKKLQA